MPQIRRTPGETVDYYWSRVVNMPCGTCLPTTFDGRNFVQRNLTLDVLLQIVDEAWLSPT